MKNKIGLYRQILANVNNITFDDYHLLGDDAVWLL
jgi:hypothetical protein